LQIQQVLYGEFESERLQKMSRIWLGRWKN
jgi:hypothetical protein